MKYIKHTGTKCKGQKSKGGKFFCTMPHVLCTIGGFSLIEILISIAVAAVILPGVVALQSLSSFTSGQSETYTKAYTIAQEEMETIYNLKNSWDWDNPAYTPLSTYGFNKTINIENVERCGYQICPVGFPGIIDKFTKKVTVTISWKERGINQQVELISYVAKI